LIGWFAGNPVAANLLMLLIMVAGLASFWQIRKEVTPRFDPRQLVVRALYPSAGPEEIEKTLCIPLEEAVHTLPGIDRLDSEATEGECQLTLSLRPGHEAQAMLGAVRARAQAVPNLPKGLEKLEITEKNEAMEAINVMFYGPLDPLRLRRLGQRVRDELRHIPGVTRIEDYNDRLTYEVTVQVAEDKLRHYNLSMAEVAEAIRKASLDLPGGSVKTEAGELLVQARGRAEATPDFADLVLRTGPDGSRLRLGDVAEIRDGLVEIPFEDRFDGAATEGWEVYSDVDAVDVARRVKAYVAKTQGQLPEGVRLATWWDNSVMFEERLQTLLEDGVAGFALVLLVLMLFLRTQIAFWAGAGILTSLLGALWLMPVFNVSLNLFSLFGFLLAMGILVDDAIIVGERVHAHQSHGLPGLAGAVRGAKDVALPVVLAALTTLAAFLPGLSLPGWAGQMMYPICVVMVLTIVFSLVEALLILPAHLAATPRPGALGRRFEPWKARLNGGLDRFVRQVFRPLLDAALRWRYLTVSLFVAFLALTLALPLAGFVRLSMEADVARDYFRVNLTLPPSAPPRDSRALAERVEKALFALGEDMSRADPAGGQVVSHLETIIVNRDVSFFVEFSPEARQRYAIDDLVRDWRQRIGDIGAANIDFLYRQGQSPYDVTVDLSAADPALVAEAATRLKQKLAAYPGVRDVGDSYVPGKPEIRIKLKPEAERLGLRLKDVAEQVRYGFYGEEAQRFQRDGEVVKAFVRLPLAERARLDALLDLPVRLPGGGLAPLRSLADLSFAPGYAKLTRQDRRRQLQVRARVDRRVADVNAVYADLEQSVMRPLRQSHPTLTVEAGRDRQEQAATAEALERNTLAALVLIYALIAVPFRSYLKPLIFLLAAPVAWSGGVLAHWLTGLPVSLESLVGMIAASGVVVNDSLVLLDYIQEKGRDGPPSAALISEACTERFRPVFLAFLTNFAGFLPTLLETSAQAQFLIPMTVSLAAGLLVGMAASLILTPACYAIFEERPGRRRV
jgi:multidrug efflux pump subunit AcrB